MFESSPDLETELDRRVEEATADPEVIARFDLDGDGRLDDTEIELLRSIVRSEILREWDGTYDEPALLRDRYRLVRLIGRGAQGELHIAHDRQTDDFVAVKVATLAGVGDWKALELFEREAQTLQRLSHPNIPAYLDYFHVSDEAGDRFVMVREYVHGASVADLLEGGSPTSSETVRKLLRDVLTTLVYLHSLSPPVVHRDIKPSNIMARPDRTYALVDFGAVQAVLPDELGGSTVVGTSGYMPAEQLMGRAEPRSDLYALGATAIRIVTGRDPSQLPVERMRLVWRDLAGVDDAVAEFIDKLVEPTAEDRFPSAQVALDALDRLDGGGTQMVAQPQGHGSYATSVREFRELMPLEEEAALVALNPPPEDGRMIVKEVDGHVRIDIPSQPEIARILMVLGAALTAGALFLLAAVPGPAGWFCLLPSIAVIYFGLDAGADSAVLTLDRGGGYRLRRRGIFGVKEFQGALDELSGAEYVRNRDNEYLALRTRNNGSPRITANCSIAEARWIAARVNRFVQEERRDDRALPGPR